MITGWLVARLGLSQLVCWGVSYYLIGVFGPAMALDFGWSATLVHGGYAAALVVMGLSSPLIGRLIDGYGGRVVMSLGSLLLAAGCLGLAAARDVAAYYLAFACLGLAMRMTLYEAAFASLARIGGSAARRPISQVTLLGGLASTVFWPIGHELAAAFGWRGALAFYAVFAILTLPLHLWIPAADARGRAIAVGQAEAQPLAGSAAERRLAAFLFVTIATLAAFLNTGMSAHMIDILAGLGVAASTAVWIATLRGIGQSGARLAEVLFGARIGPLTLGVVATAILPACFLVGLLAGLSPLFGMAFALAYGAGNGLLTIVRGTQPLVLFGHRSYGTIAGRLTAPGFFASALAPVAYASLIESFGDAAALWLSGALSLAMVLAALALRLRLAPKPPR